MRASCFRTFPSVARARSGSGRQRACRRGDIDRPLAIRAMKRFLVEWHEASGIPDVMPQITPRSADFRANADAMRGLIDDLELQIANLTVELRRQGADHRYIPLLVTALLVRPYNRETTAVPPPPDVPAAR